MSCATDVNYVFLDRLDGETGVESFLMEWVVVLLAGLRY